MRNKPAGQVFRIGAGERIWSFEMAEVHWSYWVRRDRRQFAADPAPAQERLVTQAAESFGADPPLNRNLETGLQLFAARRPTDRTKLAIVAVE